MGKTSIVRSDRSVTAKTGKRHNLGVACVFSTQHSFQGNEVRKSPLGGDATVVPRKTALADLEKEYVDYLKKCYRVERLQADTRTLSLLGVMKLDGSWDSIRPDSGHRDTLIPQVKSNYTYSICFDLLLDHLFAEEQFKRNRKGGRDLSAPSKQALKGLVKELKEYLGQNFPIYRMEVTAGGGLYFMMLDSGLI